MHLLLLASAWAGAPAPSLDALVTANGRGVAVWHAETGVLDGFSDHLYQQPSPDADATWDLLYDSYFGLRAEGTSGWLTAAGDATIEEGTGILTIDRSRGSLSLTEIAVAPMTLDHPGLLHVLRVRNDGAEAVQASVFSLHNYHLGSPRHGSNNGDETLAEADGGLAEIGAATGLGMHLLPLTAPDVVGCTDVWATVNAGGDYAPGCDRAGDDLVGGFQWDLSLDPGEEAWIGVVEAFTSGGDAATVPPLIAGWVAERSAAALLDAERADWAAWHDRAVLPALSADEARVARQSLAWLRMAQVREPGSAYGQVVASLPASTGQFEHLWNITWARDGAYSARALALSGYGEEAAAALRFLAQEGRVGAYQGYVGAPYAVSVCRYYGDGTEWSDDDGTGPNIEFDGFGLYLWALAGAGDPALWAEVGPRALDEVADVLVGLIDETGLISPDSSIWERHWNGNQKHFTYTSAWAVRGLRDAAAIADAIGDPRGDGYRAAADGIAAAMAERLIDEGGVLQGNLEETDALDLAAADAFNNGALDPALSAPSFAAWEALRLPSGGWRRNDDGDLYDLQEWIFVDLRAAEALRRACREEEAAAVEGWVTSLALANDLVLPELLDPEAATYAGPAPMLGFGAGAYLLAMHARAEAAAGCEGSAAEDSGTPDTGEEAEDSAPPAEGGGEEGKGCGCGGGAGSAAGLIGLLFAIRRRLKKDAPPQR